ncbi:uncharacterized protein A4U43_C03F26920 [Asparagus officinalis]|uniref:Uncharacterized protein n=1 Tax=Asparagus officinalis TaxID=4686 RepID=A0A5P1FE62_ASPOF|nr:uncharacterized protein A4U43_C03F26920 [Asparagus officinalis]
MCGRGKNKQRTEPSVDLKLFRCSVQLQFEFWFKSGSNWFNLVQDWFNLVQGWFKTGSRLVQTGSSWFGLVQPGLASFELIWTGLVWFNLVRSGSGLVHIIKGVLFFFLFLLLGPAPPCPSFWIFSSLEHPFSFKSSYLS